ncbi:hypothetical protein L917_18055 [Phytophthora nicotianae]|uniref:Uncharacterized protein n=2 Tax=Phytophthora nicotianae TaxID=4792 RepID=W2QVA8_PHYN3|nr:hypothetical protein PPTG_21625 [Phytophthora nicotianae INRA-310]ETL81633.1 hypothetical protein L917_18055 [Phytophthora nicotianae]ETM34852.1 hypothetical protein L914_18142 [Phytophthora nicotianae]ETN17157.1 hypothetical protein PPTG_21625 [Phytophthora nicotianae INRA-310]
MYRPKSPAGMGPSPTMDQSAAKRLFWGQSIRAIRSPAT